MRDDLPRITQRLLRTQGFYALMLVGMNKTWTKGNDPMCPTACVYRAPESINIDLMINEDFWNIWKDEHKHMLLLHEVGHVALGHLFLHDLMPDNTIRSISVDIEINQYIPGIEKLDYVSPTTIELFPEFKLKPKAGAIYYYKELMKAKQKKQKSQEKGEDSKAGEPGNGRGTSGNEILDRMIDGEEDMHKMWKALENLSETEKKLIEKQLEGQMKNYAEQIQKEKGNIPNELEEIIKRLFDVKPPVVDWRGMFRKFVGKNVSNEIKRTRKKENYRFPDSPGMKTKRKITIAFCIDESGSMSEKELEEVNNELYHQWKAGADITVAHWDTDVHFVNKYDGKLEIHRHCSGGYSVASLYSNV